jgi:hypothetical protein
LLIKISYRYLSILLLCLVALVACQQNKFKRAEQLFNQRRYAATIEQLDSFIKTGNNGAMVTRAELIRSQSYYELGVAAQGKENWALAIRLFKLANSELADIELAKVYYSIAQEAYNVGDIDKSFSYLTMITNEITQSALIPEVLHFRIKIFVENYNNTDSAWKDYMYLYDYYGNNQFEIKSRPLIETFIYKLVNKAIDEAAKKDYQSALEELFVLRQYPVGDQDKVDYEISNIYQVLAEESILKQDYFEANRLFIKAIQYYPEKQASIQKRLVDIANLYIAKGNELTKARDFNNAMLYYQKSFDIIPDFDLAKKAISNLREIQNNVKLAEKFATDAEKLETVKQYSDAQKLYSQAYQLDKLQVYQERSNIMGNLIEAEKNPLAFAKTIVLSYKNGLLNRRIQAQKNELLKKYKDDEIRDSGWKILLSPGQYKYEARYDLLTPAENIYFAWQVNLRDRSVTPLNKISEQVMQ